ncbi:hypothetical protein GobsT_14290 [Gemmata obscuriglobus]|uniref:Uncharacterized protein n=1 Tax=Gemmata obscuriglobus TaxID=114 RepID=A0A2Z3HFJ3_9BACT|nr:hypothetical protein [Gemmata obscuriglobus]AWM40140.1 hypothetical protein C1280_26135 [Gemmata obscuriglobus]QEG26684.1 hypothetical protein GobsT_14290 [Gemmata obscuriglobus]VTS02341.1 unnamed protein product [Gemmata obscuriglobus UQM 2246]
MTVAHDTGAGDRAGWSAGAADAPALGRWLDDGGRDANEPNDAGAPGRDTRAHPAGVTGGRAQN